MELVKTKRQAGLIRIAGVSVAALLLGSAAVLTVPRTIHAQNDSAVSSATDDSNAIDSDADANSADYAASPDVATPPPTIAGSWSGTADDKRLGSGSLSLSLTQATKAIAVTIWEVSFPNDSSAGGTGSGKLNGKALRLVLSDPTISSKCTMEVSSKVIVNSGVADEIKGTYTLKKCFTKNSSGTIDLTPSAAPTPTP